MIRGHVMRTILVVTSLVIIIGVALMAWSLAMARRDVIVVNLNSDDPQLVGFDNFGLIPGQSCEYKIELKNRAMSGGDVRLQFLEREEKTLKEYAYIKVTAGDLVICDERMADIFDGEGVKLPVNFDNGENTELKIEYYLPLDVGNEAKNAEVVFDLLISMAGE